MLSKIGFNCYVAAKEWDDMYIMYIYIYIYIYIYYVCIYIYYVYDVDKGVGFALNICWIDHIEFLDRVE